MQSGVNVVATWKDSFLNNGETLSRNSSNYLNHFLFKLLMYLQSYWATEWQYILRSSFLDSCFVFQYSSKNVSEFWHEGEIYYQSFLSPAPRFTNTVLWNVLISVINRFVENLKWL